MKPHNIMQEMFKNESVFVLFLSHVGASRSDNQQAHGRHLRPPLVHSLQCIWQPTAEAAVAVTG